MRIERRAFLGLGVGAAAWVACGRSSRDQTAPSRQGLALAVVSAEVALGDRRLAVALTRGGVPVALAGTEATLVPPSNDADTAGPRSDVISVEPREVTISFGQGGETGSPDVKKIYVIDHPFEDPGVWTVRFSSEDGTASTPFNVVARSESPMVGNDAIASQSPTLTDARGVDPICTRQPPCTQHEMTIAEAVRSGRPSIITFVTPALCESRTCGPALDIVEEGNKSSGRGVNFVHVEIYTNASDRKSTKPVVEWKLPGEPWIAFVDADGKVRARWSGALGAEEFPDGLDALKRGVL